MDHPVISPKKLIEVALPLDILNEACVKDKNPFLKNHPRAIHLWWARRPLAAARNVIFSQLVNDPEDLWYCQNPGVEPNKQIRGHWTKARTRLFKLIEELSLWENTTNQEVLERAREEIRKSWREICALNAQHPLAPKLFNPEILPEFHDPFSGGGAIPLEAQRLGLRATATDLNPVAVIINKAMVEFPNTFNSHKSIHEETPKQPRLLKTDDRRSAMVQDLRFLTHRIKDELEQTVRGFYPDRLVTSIDTQDRPYLEPYRGKALPVLAWLWARTVKSPNPAYSQSHVPLISTFVLSRKKGHEAYVEPVVNGNTFRFEVREGIAPPGLDSGTKLGRGCKFGCLLSGTPIDEDYIKAECSSGRSGYCLIALVCEGDREKVYLSSRPEDEQAANSVDASVLRDAISLPIANDPRNLWCVNYGVARFDQLYTDRQIFALSTISDSIRKIYIELTAKHAGLESYLSAIAAYLACGLSQLARYSCVNCSWNVTNENIVQAFGRQAIPMTWDFAECNPFHGALSIEATMQWVTDAIASLQTEVSGRAFQHDARVKLASDHSVIISTDPPYYDNITYGDLSDFFYVWLRRTLRLVFPDLFSTMSVPKQDELIVAPYRHKTKTDAETFFLEGMKRAIQGMVSSSHPAFPITIYYAFKQSETKQGIGTSSTGWETFLEAVVQSGLRVSGTWPMRTEKVDAYKSKVNALASSIVLVCRPRSKDASAISRREFIRELNATLPQALDAMTRESEGLPSPVAPVDLSQAIIGPGMAVFSKYNAVLEADGTAMSVRTALQLINRFLAEDDFDADTQFCLHWFEQHGWDIGKFGEADTLARAKGTSVDGVKQSGVLYASSGNVRLLKWSEYSNDWDPKSDQRLPIWEVLHQLIRVFNTEGETGAAAVFAAVQSKAEAARQLAYRLYTLCERKNWAEDARAYNEVVTSWSSIESAAAKEPAAIQRTLFDN